MQEDPLAMLSYTIGVLPLIKILKVEYPDVTHTWCADDDGALGTFDNIELYFNLFKKIGPGCGYYPKPLKSVIIMHMDNLTSGKKLSFRHGFKVFTGTRYLGGFIGDDESKRKWLKYWTSKWEKNIPVINKMSGKYPQES